MSERDAISVTSDAFTDILTESRVTRRCKDMSDDTKQSRFIIIQSLNGKEIKVDITIKFLLFIF